MPFTKVKYGVGVVVTAAASRCQHSPTTSSAGCPSTQRSLVFELRLHDDVMLVLQVQQNGSELLILTQVLKWRMEENVSTKR